MHVSCAEFRGKCGCQIWIHKDSMFEVKVCIAPNPRMIDCSGVEERSLFHVDSVCARTVCSSF